MLFVLYFLLASVTFGAIILLKTYTHIPAKELKRRARSGDELAQLLFRAATYGDSLEILLWIIIGLGAAGFFVVLSRSLATWIAILGSAALLWLGFAWLPYTRVTVVGKVLAKWVTAPLAWLLLQTYPVLSRVARMTGKYRNLHLHSGVYEKEDLLELLDRQQSQIDNRLSEDELQIARNALTFGNKIIRDIMTPRKVAVMVSVTDAVGPILLDELHKSGHSRFPVYEGKQDRIVGTLYLHDLMDLNAGATGQVRDFMHKQVYYLHDEEPLRDALQAFLKTRHHLFVVVNSFEDIVGLVTLEDVLEQIVGEPIVDEFDQYDDMRAVAQRLVQKEQKQHTQHQQDTTEIPPEVIESEELWFGESLPTIITGSASRAWRLCLCNRPAHLAV